ncbi:replication-associated recombination protein A [Ruminococcus sp.]|uniref:replication-associated recombination protein A n=1 Tax=Ruminococcus sp. TaxID=41978 RepID=UPI002CDF31D5|nr:replication-associated recombination protein A [Ruminococcus sp.]HNZ98320.1 replication-associated recombination protein A [Ruminococcus sp.]HOH87846.1 replication-associated recombination protein A [Ruminococcus sp.]
MSAPLADKIRPKTLTDVVGQEHILGEGKPLRRIIESGTVPNMIFYGPSGVGKTTVARIIAENCGMSLYKLNGTNASLSDIKDVVAEIGTFRSENGILLYLDEIQYLNKKQQQSLLEYIENGEITLIASTTENPYFAVYNAVISRSTVFEFKPVTAEQLIPAIKRAFRIMSEENGYEIEASDDIITRIAYSCGGDVRKAMNTAELAVVCGEPSDGKVTITEDSLEVLAQRSNMRYDRDGDQHYDILSAFHKSVRGSDENAALHYAARLIAAGDIISLCRRMLCIASEDVGLAYPMAVPIVKACVDSALQLGLPEAKLPIAEAIILMATAPKSNSACMAIDAALDDLKSCDALDFPRHLQNVHFDGNGAKVVGQHYLYPHDFPNHYVKQQYLPDALKDRVYYHYGENKQEQSAYQYRQKLLSEADK